MSCGGACPWASSVSPEAVVVAVAGDDAVYLNTLGNRIAIRKTRDLGKLAEAEEKVVWRAPATGPNAQSVWAPELHRIQGKWYLYYTAAAAGHDDDAHRGIFVLENAAKDPQESIRWFRDAINFLCEYVRSQGYDLKFALEAKPNEPRGDIYLPTTGAMLASFLTTGGLRLPLALPALVERGLSAQLSMQSLLTGLLFAACIWRYGAGVEGGLALVFTGMLVAGLAQATPWDLAHLNVVDAPAGFHGSVGDNESGYSHQPERRLCCIFRNRKMIGDPFRGHLKTGCCREAWADSSGPKVIRGPRIKQGYEF